ncbi:MAG: hypothetical protein ACC661_11955 [Verrucomicrobiales bacterium]
MSYLEVICEDSTPPDIIEGALSRFEDRIQSYAPINHDGVLILYHEGPGLSGNEGLEYSLLKTAILDLIRAQG